MLSTQIKNFNQDMICFKDHSIPRSTRKYHCLLLWMTIIYVVSMQWHVPSLQVWVVVQIVTATLGLVVIQCVVD